MQDVSTIWYRIYYWWIVCFSILVGTGIILSDYFSSLQKTRIEFALNPNVIILVVLCLAFCAIVYKRLRADNRSFVALLPILFFLLVLLYGIQNSTANGSLVYIFALIITIGFSALYGTPALVATSFGTVTYILIISSFEQSGPAPQKVILIFGTILVTFISWWVWGRLSLHYSIKKIGNRLSKQLETSEEKSAIIIQSISDGVIVFDVDGKITLMNPAASALTEWDVQDAIGLDVRLVMKMAAEDGSSLPGSDDVFTIAISKKENISRILLLNGHSSMQTIVSLVISPLVAPAENEAVGAVAVFRDVTKEKQAEQQRADFISTASHEMRTPIAAVEGYLALALNPELSKIDENARGYLEKAHTSTQHLGQLFQDLLTSAKAEDGRLTSHPVIIEVGSFIQQLIENLRLVAKQKQLELEFRVGGNDDVTTGKDKNRNNHTIDPLYYVDVDPDRLQEVMSNIFDNAIKYTTHGKITIGLTGDKENVEISVADTGQGIPEEDIPHLFQKFYRVDNAATRSIGGTGLGLYISSKIVELYRGRIWVESKLGKGSTFYMTFPRVDTVQAQERRKR